jgi:hypothetical protein
MAQMQAITAAQLEEAFEQRRIALRQQVEEMIAAAVQPLKDQIAALEADAVSYKDKVSLKADGGMFICAEDGGPKEERQPFNLTSRAENAGAWEAFKLVKGQG